MLDSELQVELEMEDPGPGERLALEDRSVKAPPPPVRPAGQRKPKYRAHGKQPWGALRKIQRMRETMSRLRPSTRSSTTTLCFLQTNCNNG